MNSLHLEVLGWIPSILECSELTNLFNSLRLIIGLTVPSFLGMSSMLEMKLSAFGMVSGEISPFYVASWILPLARIPLSLLVHVGEEFLASVFGVGCQLALICDLVLAPPPLGLLWFVSNSDNDVLNTLLPIPLIVDLWHALMTAQGSYLLPYFLKYSWSKLFVGWTQPLYYKNNSHI